jgi:hypothetical protein
LPGNFNEVSVVYFSTFSTYGYVVLPRIVAAVVAFMSFSQQTLIDQLVGSGDLKTPEIVAAMQQIDRY